MSTQLQDVCTEFNWQPQPAAAQLVGRLLDRAIRGNPQIRALADRMRGQTGTRLVDWVDSITLGNADGMGETTGRQLAEAGFAASDVSGKRWRHPAGIFPTIEVSSEWASVDGEMTPAVVSIKVSALEDFAAAMTEFGPAKIEGPAGGQFRTCRIESDRAPALVAIERHGWPGMSPPPNRAQQIAVAAKHRRSLAQRRRSGQSDAEGFELASRLFEAAAADLGRDWACDLFFAAERDYWMSRNEAARVQYERQQKLGLGWGNHDHHTYRSSRSCFALLIGVLEQMGFECRERFYAGREAGWGAQVLEQRECGVVIFADVDLTPEEVAGDFAHQPLPPPSTLGTVGLWCQLHGEAFLEAGMHHLECQFDFDAVRAQLATVGVETMAPFTDWPHLKQAFTKGAVWPVRDDRINAARAAGLITDEQAVQFSRDGAIGSHLEILERNDGFKGFNQTGISEIITRTDPRKWRD